MLLPELQPTKLPVFQGISLVPRMIPPTPCRKGAAVGLKKNKIIRVVLIVLAAGAALWLGAVFLLPVVLPFLIGC